MFKRLFLFFTAFVFLAGCSTNPATGAKQFTAFMSSAQEQQVGAQEHEKILKEYGLYDDERLQEYVSEVGKNVTARTERPDVTYRFFLLDSPIVNAFALPGGYIYLTRGLMALAGSEAEMAAVLAHEAGHITARHSAERYSRGVATSIGASILSAAIDSSGVTQALGIGSDLYLKSYSREQESEADILGIRYLGRAGYDVNAMASFLQRLQADSALERRLAGQTGFNPLNTFFATHPATGDRVSKTVAEARAAARGEGGGAVGRDAYLRVIDGMIYGDSAAQGFVRGDTFVHPELGFIFSVPEDYRLFNSPSQVVAKGMGASNGGLIIFDIQRNAERVSPMRYLRDDWLKGQAVERAEEITVGGMKAATASLAGRFDNRNVMLQLVAVRWGDDQIARFQVVLPPNPTSSQLDALKAATYSFRKMKADEYKSYSPRRIRIVTAKDGDTVTSLSARMAVDDYREERFRVLNGLSAGQKLQPGQLYKIVASF
ncbi:MAG: M48 family metalloprotease [Alphaproteobacteria bacterium]